MFSRNFLTFSVLVLIFAIVCISAENEAEVDYDESSLDSEIEARSKTLKKVLKILEKFFKHASKECLKAAANKCKKYWYNPAKVISCAKDFFSVENIECLVGA